MEPGAKGEAPNRPGHDAPAHESPDEQDGDEHDGDEADAAGDKDAGDKNEDEDAGVAARKKRRPTVLIIVVLVVVTPGRRSAGCTTGSSAAKDIEEHGRRLHRRARHADRAAGRRPGRLARRHRQPVRPQGRRADPHRSAPVRQTSRPGAGPARHGQGAARAARSSAPRSPRRTSPPRCRRRRRNLDRQGQPVQARPTTTARRACRAQATTQQEVDYATAALQQAAGAGAARPGRACVQADPGAAEHRPVRGAGPQPRAGRAGAGASSTRRSSTSPTWCVKAPQDGWITKRNVETGNYVTAGPADLLHRLAGRVGHGQFQGNAARPDAAGPEVTIDVDAYPTLKLTGHVDSIQLGSGSQVHRVPAGERDRQLRQDRAARAGEDRHRWRAGPDLPLPLGISVEPRYGHERRPADLAAASCHEASAEPQRPRGAADAGGSRPIPG